MPGARRVFSSFFFFIRTRRCKTKRCNSIVRYIVIGCTHIPPVRDNDRCMPDFLVPINSLGIRSSLLYIYGKAVGGHDRSLHFSGVYNILFSFLFFLFFSLFLFFLPFKESCSYQYVNLFINKRRERYFASLKQATSFSSSSLSSSVR